ncbi:hypothetical protein OESDEN_00919 [Oesophagostomum dentatum]|uniref:Uncharacterized protein n=1 Tax=Oesophagostomum dentatum TaxID=61180 RepID=A0A0B1TUI6_OESDE|nr:hypothetical protein OESDEN_00919 [Oesophagostomum dentatum]
MTSSMDMLRTFKELLPADLKKSIESLNLSERSEVINFLSDLYHGRVRMPENKEEIVQFIKEKLPTVYEKLDALNASIYEKFARIKPDAQNT